MKWGSWELQEEHLLLVHPHYEISLSEMTSSARMLDWIFQIQEKTWATAPVMKDLLTALDEIFYPQSSLCGGGVDRTLDAAGAVRQYIADQAS